MPISLSEKPKLLITGASGFLGHDLCRLAVSQWTVYGTCLHNTIQVPGVVPVKVDLNNLDTLAQLVNRLRPQTVIHAAAQSQVVVCESQPKQARHLNVVVPTRLAEICAQGNIGYIFLSTDLVFDGRDAPYHENDKTGPQCEYARQKVAAELSVLNENPDALVCRLPLMFGLAPNAPRHFTVQMLSAILSEHPVDLFVDEFRTPVDTASAARGVLTVMGKARGLLHLGGRTRISRYGLGCCMAKGLQKTPTMLRPMAIEDSRLPVARVPDCSLVSDSAYALGYDPASLDDAVTVLAHRYLKTQKKR